jgi:hypothetical protein
MVGANLVTSHLNQFKPGHGSFCMKGFKDCYREHSYGWCASQLYHCYYENNNNKTFLFQNDPVLKTPNLESFSEPEYFTETEQKANEQQCHYLARVEVKMCETLCDNDIAKIYDCLGVCMALGAKTKSEYCPYERNCPDGCPCSDYDCERGFTSSAGIFALEIHPDYSTSNSFIITSVANKTVIPAQKFKLETSESWQKNMCSQIHGSMHFVFEAILNFVVTDDGYRITNQVKIYVVDEVMVRKGLF